MEILLPGYVQELLHRLQVANHEAYIVGGCVRDSLLGRTPHDWDMTTSALPEQIKSALSGVRILDTGIQHGTVTALTDQGEVEITTYRVDGTYSDGRRPDSVSFTRSLREDLARRDFTINALAYAPNVGVVDLFGGREDLQAGQIRCVGQPEQRFGEDALRIIRGLRFAATLGFSIEEKTAAAIRSLAPTLQRIAVERLQAELSRLLCAHPDPLFAAYPEVFQQLFRQPMQFLPVEGVAARLHLRLARLLAPLCAEDADAALEYLRYDNATRRAVRRLLAYQKTPLPPERPALRRLRGALGSELAGDLLLLRQDLGEDMQLQQALLQKILADGDCCTIGELAVNGEDLLAAGIPAGKQLGNTLQWLLEQVITDALPNQRSCLLQAFRSA